MRQPSDNEWSFSVSALSHAMQAAINQAVIQGLTDEDVFRAISSVMGYAATSQQLGSVDHWLDQLRRTSGLAATMAMDAKGYGFNTKGTA